MEKGLEIQMIRDFRRFLARDGVTITLKYDTAPVGVTHNLWNTGVAHSVEVRALRKMLSQVDFRDNQLANTLTGKASFYIADDIDLSNVKNVRVEYNNRIFDIDKAVPEQPLSNSRFLYIILIQK